ncbi:phosphatase PAP2 family protein, partial [Staphylococcus aureus]|nr:phosphatase PAP2 family protein [Staphylococcus aureus]
VSYLKCVAFFSFIRLNNSHISSKVTAMGSTAYFGSGIYLLNRLNQGNSKGILIGLCAAMILLISISRVYLGVHYPTDIIAGIIGGVFCIILSTLLLRNKLIN